MRYRGLALFRSGWALELELELELETDEFGCFGGGAPLLEDAGMTGLEGVSLEDLPGLCFSDDLVLLNCPFWLLDPDWAADLMSAFPEADIWRQQEGSAFLVKLTCSAGEVSNLNRQVRYFA